MIIFDTSNLLYSSVNYVISNVQVFNINTIATSI